MELQLTRAMLVVQHPVIEAQLLADGRPQQLVASIIAQAMLSGLDNFLSSAEVANSQLKTAKLENLTFQLDRIPLADIDTGCTYQSGAMPPS